MDNKDEYINSLLLSLFLMQGEIDRLNQTLDLARKGELVYINNPQIKELKAENEQLQALCDTYKTCYQAKHSDIKCLFIKYKQALQDIKELAEEIADTGNWLNCGYNASRAKKILDLITKEEEE